MVSDESAEKRSAVKALLDAGTVWAATGYGQPVVDAAAAALAVGVDSPTLRVLAGAPARFADEEATEFASDAFAELGLALPAKFSEEAYVALARLKAQQFLDGGMSARQLANELWGLYSACDYSPALAVASGLGDWYSLLDDGAIPSSEAAVATHAESVGGLAVSIDELLMVCSTSKRSRVGNVEHNDSDHGRNGQILTSKWWKVALEIRSTDLEDLTGAGPVADAMVAKALEAKAGW